MKLKLYLINVVLFFFNYIAIAQNQSVENLIKKLNKKTDTVQADLNIKIAGVFMESDPTLGIQYANNAINISEEISYPFGYSKGYNTKGICYDILGSYDSALYCYNLALKNISQIKNNAFSAGVYNNIGLIYWNKDDYTKALKNFNIASYLINQTNNLSIKANINNNLGLIYHDTKEYEQSNLFFKKSIELNFKNNDTSNAIASIINLAINYYETNKFEESKKLFEYYYNYIEKIDEYNKSEFLINKITLDINTKITAQTEKDLLKVFELKEKIGHTIGLANAYIQQSELYQKKADYRNSIQANYNSLKLLDELKSLKKLEKVYKLLFINYLNLNNKDSVLKYNQLYIQTIDSMFANDRVKAISKEKIAFKTFEKEKENSALLLKINEEKLKNQWMIFIGLGLTACISFTIWFTMYKRKQKLIKKQNIELNETILETEQIERARIARDLHDSVGQKLSVVKMQLSMKNANTQSASKLLDEAIQDVRNVSHNLMPTDMSKGLFVAIENMSELMNLSSNTLKVHLNITDAARLLVINKQQSILIYRMIQELLNNAIKYAKAKNIHINMDCKKNQLTLNLTDDGVGFDINSIENKNGLGIKSIKERVQQMIGNVQLISKDGKGTQYQISIPV